MMDLIRKHWGVPAKVGMRVDTAYGPGYIVGSNGYMALRIRLNGETETRAFHPKKVEYPLEIPSFNSATSASLR